MTQIINGEEITKQAGKKDCAFCIDLFEINAKYAKLNSEHETLRVLNNMEKEKRRKAEQSLDELISKENDDCKKRLNELSVLNKKIIIFNKKKIARQSTKRKQALEKIEKYTIEQFCDNCEDIGSTELISHCEFCEYNEILDIINKAKDGE